jgi:hypothetical protein
MKGFSIQPAPQGIYPAVCHLGFIYLPLTDEGLARLRAAAASPGELRRVVLEVVGVSTYLKEQIEQLWTAESAEQLRRTLAQHFP